MFIFTLLFGSAHSQCPTPEQLLQQMDSCLPSPWDDDRYLLPVLQDDPLLQLDIDQEDEQEPNNHDDIMQRYTYSMWECTCDTLFQHHRLHKSEQAVGEYKSTLSRALADLAQMR